MLICTSDPRLLSVTMWRHTGRRSGSRNLPWLPVWITVSNAILYGLSKVFLNRLQLVQNRAARIVTFTKKYEHIAPSLIELHWLPVEYRIIYKISLLVYKAVMDFHQDIHPICSVFVTAPSLCVLARISYFKSQELS